jgi:dienelactone hydrolase
MTSPPSPPSGVERLTAVGYSMGGLVAQLLWRRHPQLTAALVLCATPRNMAGSPWERAVALALPGLVSAATLVPAVQAMRADIVGAALLDHDTDPADRSWAIQEMRRTPLIDALLAVQAACGFTSHAWIGSVDIPTAVVVTRDDQVVPARRQHKLARAVPNSTLIEIDGGHNVSWTRRAGSRPPSWPRAMRSMPLPRARRRPRPAHPERPDRTRTRHPRTTARRPATAGRTRASVRPVGLPWRWSDAARAGRRHRGRFGGLNVVRANGHRSRG